MQIYFAASIRGGREFEQAYRELIDVLTGFGTVLTEHVGDPADAERGLTDGEIYERDLEWLRGADVVIAEVTTPSLGVGYELAVAERLSKPVLCLFRAGSGRSLSAMVSGAPGLVVEEYESLGEARSLVAAFLGTL